jgi:hypothetical protein
VIVDLPRAVTNRIVFAGILLSSPEEHQTQGVWHKHICESTVVPKLNVLEYSISPQVDDPHSLHIVR